MKKLIVLGSNSFSGSSFVDFALKKNFSVLGISRSSEPNKAFLPYKEFDYQNFKFQECDINKNLELIIEIIRDSKPAYIVNFAAQSMVGESWKSPEDWFITNTVSTIKFHEKLRKLDFLKRYVHVSTPEVYGSCFGFVKEDFPFNPSTPYAVSRAAADMSLRTFYNEYKFPVVTTRAANVYGPGQQLYRIIPRTILYVLLGRKIELHGGGVSTRSFIHIRDVCDATFKIMENGENGETYHISTANVISILELVQKICIKLGVKVENHIEFVGERMGKDSAYHLDSSKVRGKLGWKDQILLDDGINECIAWVKKNLEILKNEPFDYIHKP